MNEARESGGRDRSLDFVKGVLVLFMILYHWINYFVSTEGAVYRYLRFVTPSFIFIAGFLVSHALLGKYGCGDLRLPSRLFFRGVKILLLFTLLNFAVQVVRYGSPWGMVSDFRSFYGTADAADAAFQVLVPISYLLFACSGILLLRYACGIPVVVVSTALFLGILVLDLSGVVVANLELIGAGILGLVLGAIPIDRIRRVEGHRTIYVIVYVAYTIAVWRLGVAYPLQLLGVCLNLLLFHYVGTRYCDGGVVAPRVIRLGRYSLFAYIIQIVILQLLRPSLRFLDSKHVAAMVAFLAVMVLTELAVVLVEFTRSKSRCVDRGYKLVFA